MNSGKSLEEATYLATIGIGFLALGYAMFGINESKNYATFPAYGGGFSNLGHIPMG
ncbi:hypothetical protein HY995_04085 [Candidatus Micrarchaeota archaeon]|nr:hypothetical protein [Candidatus Micrarchaeota archaeon]MBI5177237.1 hypothetical protein [Candidatus Micrarchaeota archaeon]